MVKAIRLASLPVRQPAAVQETALGQQGKAVGCVPPTALLFVALGQRSSTYLEIESNDTLTRTGPRASMPEFLGLSSNSKARRHLRRASFLLRD